MEYRVTGNSITGHGELFCCSDTLNERESKEVGKKYGKEKSGFIKSTEMIEDLSKKSDT